MLGLFHTVSMSSLVIFESAWVFIEKPQTCRNNRKQNKIEKQRERELPGPAYLFWHCSGPAHRGQSRLLPPASRQRGSVARARAFPATSCLPTIP